MVKLMHSDITIHHTALETRVKDLPYIKNNAHYVAIEILIEKGNAEF